MVDKFFRHANPVYNGVSCLKDLIKIQNPQSVLIKIDDSGYAGIKVLNRFY